MKQTGSLTKVVLVHTISQKQGSLEHGPEHHIRKCVPRRCSRIKVAGKSCKLLLTVAKFKLSQEMVGNLVESLKEIKVAMEYNNFNFKADKLQQYEEARRSLSCKYFDNPEIFGLDRYASTDEEHKLQIKTDYKRVLEKSKELCRKTFLMQ